MKIITNTMMIIRRVSLDFSSPWPTEESPSMNFSSSELPSPLPSSFSSPSSSVLDSSSDGSFYSCVSQVPPSSIIVPSSQTFFSVSVGHAAVSNMNRTTSGESPT